MSVYHGNYNVLSDAAGSVIPIQLSIAQLNNPTGILFDITGVGSAPAGVFGAIKGITLDLQALTAGTVTLTSPDLPDWQSQGSFGGFQIIRVPGQTSRLQVTGSGAAGGIAAFTLWNSTPSSEVQSLANLNATVAGSVTISGIANVAITGTPNVNIANTPAVSITGTPAVTISGTPTVNIGNSPAVTISGTPSVSVTSGNVGITSLGSVNIANAFTYQQTQPQLSYTFVSNIAPPFTGNILSTTGTKGIVVQNMFFNATGLVAPAGGCTVQLFIEDNFSSTVFYQTGFQVPGNTTTVFGDIFNSTDLGWVWNTGAAMTLALHAVVGAGTLGGGIFNFSLGYYVPP